VSLSSTGTFQAGHSKTTRILSPGTEIEYQARQDAAIYTSNRVHLTESAYRNQVERALVQRTEIEAIEKAERYFPLTVAAVKPEVAKQFDWISKAGTVHTYEHVETFRNIHVDKENGQFYDQEQKPITKEAAIAYATSLKTEAIVPEQVKFADKKLIEYDWGQSFGLG